MCNVTLHCLKSSCKIIHKKPAEVGTPVANSGKYCTRHRFCIKCSANLSKKNSKEVAHVSDQYV
jgi:hypothetical protein